MISFTKQKEYIFFKAFQCSGRYGFFEYGKYHGIKNHKRFKKIVF